MNEFNNFPYYRKLSNGRIYYKILDSNHFEEIQLLGNKQLFHQIEAVQYPEKLKIMDLLALENPVYLEATEQEWQMFVSG